MTAAGPEGDGALALRAANGDERAFKELMGRHKTGIYRFVRRCIGEPDDAFDLVQETFVSAWIALPRFDAKRSFGTWLRTIALNKCRDYGRRQTVRRLMFGRGPVDPAELEDHPDPARSPEQTLSDRERLTRLDLAISELPRPLREPLILTALEGLSQAEAATLLRTSVKSIESRVYRAKRQLAARLREEGVSSSSEGD